MYFHHLLAQVLAMVVVDPGAVDQLSTSPTTTQWFAETVYEAPGELDSLGISCLALGPNDELQVVCEQWTATAYKRRRLYWMVKAAGDWGTPEQVTRETPHSHGPPSRSNYLPSMAADGMGQTHVSYRRRCQSWEPGCSIYDYNVLEIATRDEAGFWQGQRVDDANRDEGSSSLRVDADDHLLVAYRWRALGGSDDVAFVAGKTSGGGPWYTPCEIVSAPLSQEHVSLAIDSAGLPRLAFVASLRNVLNGVRRIGVAVATPAEHDDSNCVFGNYVFLEEHRLLLPTPGSGCHMDHPAIAVGGPPGYDDRTAVVFNCNPSGGQNSVYYSYADGFPGEPNAWSSPELLAVSSRHPSLVVDRDGTTWVVFQTDEGQGNRVQVVSGGPGAWTSPNAIDLGPGEQRVEWGEPAMVVDSMNVVHVVLNVDWRAVRHAWIEPQAR